MALALVDPQPRPALRLLRGGVAARPASAVHRRRQVVALVLAVAFVVVAMAGLQATVLSTGPSDRPLSGPDGAVPVAAGHETLVVQPGDTVWSIARRLQPTGDVRPLVDDLVAHNGGAALEAGQTLVLAG